MVLVDNATPPWPAVTDDSGDLTSGTKFDSAYDQAAKDTLDALLHSTADTSKSPADIIAEMKDARGNESSLNARISGVVDADGNPVNVLSASHVRNGFVYGNMLANDTFAMWSRGDTSAPDFWTSSGSPTIARCGVGQADTTVLSGMDHFSCKLTYGAAAGILYQDAITAAALARLDQGFLNRYRPVDAAGATVSGYDADVDPTLYAYLIGHVKASGSSLARLRLDGNGTGNYSPYHPGDGGWYTLIAQLQHNVSVGRYRAQLRVEQAGSAYFQGIGLYLTPLALPPMYIPARVRYKTLTYYTNNPATGVLSYFTFARPAFIIGAQMQCLTAGTGTAATCDLLTPIGGVYSSLFATLPTIAINQLVGAAQECDPAAANYRRRTIRPALSASATQVDNTSLRLDYVDDGGGALRDLMVTIHYFEYDRPLDQFRAISDLGE